MEEEEMKYTQDQIDALVKAALEFYTEDFRDRTNQTYQTLREATEPFREKKARVGYLSFCNAEESTIVVELTDSVRLRLSDTAGVSVDDILSVLVKNDDYNSDKRNAIMDLIKDAAPKTEEL